MRFAVALLALALAACNQQPAGPAAEEEYAVRVPPPWFICDSLNEASVFVFERTQNNDVHVAEYGKSSGELLARNGYFVGDEEGAAGSINIELVRDNGADAWARQINPGALETPASAYTLPFVSTLIEGREIQCRWMARTRVAGFTSRRSFVVSEDAAGAISYRAYNFADAASARAVSAGENTRTTNASLELSNGVAGQTPEATTYTFETQGFRYVLSLNRDGAGLLDVTRDGAPLMSEPLIGYQQGTPPAPAAATP
jgi:hypothetical protein